MSSDFLWSVGAFFIVLTPIILIHELGHFVAAKLSNIRVDEFGLGFPPRALKLGTWDGTVFSLNWIPLGGFVRPAGEDDPDVPGGLSGASKRARLFVLSAGAMANFLTAIIIFWIAYMLGTPAIGVDTVNPNSPAESAGFQSGDVFYYVEGELADGTGMIVRAMQENAGEPVSVTMLRDGEEVDLAVTPRLPGEFDASKEGAIGLTLDIAPEGLHMQRSPLDAATESLNSVFEIVYLTVTVPQMLLSGEITPSEARPVSVIGISQIAGEAAEASVNNNSFFPILQMIAFISVALGFTNLLPIPALDGGRILFVLIEGVRGRRIEPEREGMVHVVGMLVLLGLMVLLIVQDIVNPVF